MKNNTLSAKIKWRIADPEKARIKKVNRQYSEHMILLSIILFRTREWRYRPFLFLLAIGQILQMILIRFNR